MFCSTGQTLTLGNALNYVRRLEQDSKMSLKVDPECAAVQTPTQEKYQAAAGKTGGEAQHFCNIEACISPLENCHQLHSPC